MHTLLAATGSGLLSIDDSADPDLVGREVNAIHLGPAGRLALVDASELWQDSGSGWEKRAASSYRLECVATRGEEIWVGTSEARLMSLQTGELEPSATFDGAPGRGDWFTPWGGPPAVRSIAMGERSMFVNVHVGGILRQDLGTVGWQPTIEIGADVHEVVVQSDYEDNVFAATAKGLAFSSDAGESWTYSTEGLHAPYSRAIAIGDNSIYMSSSQGPFGGRAAVYRRPANEDKFIRCEQGLPSFEGNIDTGCLTAIGAEVAFGTGDGRVFWSGDKGGSWEQVAADLDSVFWLRFEG